MRDLAESIQDRLDNNQMESFRACLVLFDGRICVKGRWESARQVVDGYVLHNSGDLKAGQWFQQFYKEWPGKRAEAEQSKMLWFINATLYASGNSMNVGVLPIPAEAVCLVAQVSQHE